MGQLVSGAEPDYLYQLLIFIGKTPGDQLIVVAAEAGSSAENQLLWLLSSRGSTTR